MFDSKIESIKYSNGEIQRVQLVRFDDWTSADFFFPDYSKGSFDQLCNIYRDFIVPKCPWIFGQMILFHVPENFPYRDFSFFSEKYGNFIDVQTAAALVLRQGVRIICGKPVFSCNDAKSLFCSLRDAGYLHIACGYLPETEVLPVSDSFGFMTACEKSALLKVNSSFFLMDRFDCATVYDKLGIPIGLYVKDGQVLNPPMYERESFAVFNDGQCRIFIPRLTDLIISIDGKSYMHGDNATFYTRPYYSFTPAGNYTDIVISGCKVCAVHNGGRTPVPASGFVLRCENARILPGSSVSFLGYEHIRFAVQVGNSAVVDGVKTERFTSPFYNIRRPWNTPFPPSLYPLDYQNSRAPRIALGCDSFNRPMLLWAEGAGKTGYHPGHDSCGASLQEISEICKSFGMHNAVNLDGGGSAQILINNTRSLLISDRNIKDNSEAERAVPVGIIIRN